MDIIRFMDRMGFAVAKKVRGLESRYIFFINRRRNVLVRLGRLNGRWEVVIHLPIDAKMPQMMIPLLTSKVFRGEYEHCLIWLGEFDFFTKQAQVALAKLLVDCGAMRGRFYASSKLHPKFTLGDRFELGYQNLEIASVLKMVGGLTSPPFFVARISCSIDF